MDQFTLNLIFVGGSFLLYIAIAIWAKAGSTSEFYAAGRSVHPVTNGMAIAADWMSAASFISMAGLIAFVGYGNSAYLMGWTDDTSEYTALSELEWGSRGREFKSLHPDQKSPVNTAFSGLSHFWTMAKNGIKLEPTNNITNNIC